MVIPERHDPSLLPTGYAWRRAAVQLEERIGALPGDRIAVLAPATNDPIPQLCARLPRIEWIQILGGPFGHDKNDTPEVTRIAASPFTPPFDDETLDGVVCVLAIPLLDTPEHEKFVAAWARALAPFGKWLALLAVDSSRDPRLKTAEDDLKRSGFTRVRTNRLGGGGGKETLAIMSARKG